MERGGEANPMPTLGSATNSLQHLQTHCRAFLAKSEVLALVHLRVKGLMRVDQNAQHCQYLLPDAAQIDSSKAALPKPPFATSWVLLFMAPAALGGDALLLLSQTWWEETATCSRDRERHQQATSLCTLPQVDRAIFLLGYRPEQANHEGLTTLTISDIF